MILNVNFPGLRETWGKHKTAFKGNKMRNKCDIWTLGKYEGQVYMR